MRELIHLLAEKTDLHYHDKRRAIYSCLEPYKPGFGSPLHTRKQQTVRGSVLLTIILGKKKIRFYRYCGKIMEYW